MKRPQQRNRSASTGSYKDDTVRRNRSASAGSHSEGLMHGQDLPTSQECRLTSEMLSSLLHLKKAGSMSKSWVHCRDTNLNLFKVLLDRSRQLDEFEEQQGQNQQGSSAKACTSMQTQVLLTADGESGYTPLHSAIVNGNLETILLLLRFAMDFEHTERLVQRPMIALHPNHKNGAGAVKNSYQELLYKMTTRVDLDGLTPLELLTRIQQPELQKCRFALKEAREQPIRKLQCMASVGLFASDRNRRSSFDLQEGHDDQDEFQGLSRGLSVLQESSHPSSAIASNDTSYAFEVVAFGRAHPSTLGVTSGFKNSHAASLPDSSDKNPTSPRTTKKQSVSKTSSSSAGASATTNSSLFRPQRVQAFAQDRIGRSRSAVTVAAATHHSLVITRDGQLFAFGLGKGGRLGNNEETQCPLPTRILGALARKHVVAVAAAENHSLCATSDGAVYGWGSNRFGQVLGSSGASSEAANTSSRCFLPRRVEDLKKVPCIAVAAGERHSVALSSRGDVWVWGDNTAGQLGIHRRNGIQKVQCVEALRGRIQAGLPSSLQQCVAIAASAQSTMALMSPAASSGLLPLNSVYTWGHGNHVPIKAHFGGEKRWSTSQQQQRPHQQLLRRKHDRTINPIAIACAKHHYVSITSDGHVYSWGLHADPLGTRKSKDQQSPQKPKTSSPQLVTGMLPENGGGLAVAVAASEQHTAVVTDCGELYTWGATHGKNVLGHEGLKWQPNPTKVPGVHRAVGVAIAKEHTLLLIGASFPVPPLASSNSGSTNSCKSNGGEGITTLAALAAHKVAEHVDLFNAIPLLIMAEKVQSTVLADYCSDFVRRNLDGVLNLGQKSLMDQYLNDRLADSLHRSGIRYRDDPHHHPFVHDLLTAGTVDRPRFENRDSWLSSKNDWIKACSKLASQRLVQRIVQNAVASADAATGRIGEQRRKSRGQSVSIELKDLNKGVSAETRQVSICRADEDARILEHCKKMTRDLCLTNLQAAQAKHDWLTKEIRGTRKRLNQICRLEETPVEGLTPEQLDKIARRPHLDSMMLLLEPALELVEQRLKVLNLPTKHGCGDGKDGGEASEVDGAEEPPNVSLSCKICNVKCPDAKSFALHQNGRKHRNRVAQAAAEDQKKTAASIMENREKKQLFNAPEQIRRAMRPSTPNNPWKSDPTVSSEQPKFKLPPPPHPVVTQVVPNQESGNRANDKVSPTKARKGATDLRKIMQEQADKPKQSAWKTAPASSSMTRVAPINLHSTARPRSSPSSKQSTAIGKVLLPSGLSSPLPVWDAPSPSSTRCVPLDLYRSPTKSEKSHSHQAYSLGDFLTPKQNPKKALSPSLAPWSGTKENHVLATKASPSSKSVSLLEIQQDEADFKSKQDQDFGVANGGSWFIGERRERADSFLAIQENDVKEREERLLIEEQLRIEAQIRKNLEEQRKSETQTAKSKRRGKRNSNKKNEKKEANTARTGETTAGRFNDATQPSETNVKDGSRVDISNHGRNQRNGGPFKKNRKNCGRKKAAKPSSPSNKEP